MRVGMSKIIESSIRMAVTALTLAPSIGIMYLYFRSTNDIAGALKLAMPLMISFNILVAGIALVACAPMMKGNEIK